MRFRHAIIRNLMWISTASWVVSLVAVLAIWMLFVFHASDPSTPDRFMLVYCIYIGTPATFVLGFLGTIVSVLGENWPRLIESIFGPSAMMVNFFALSQVKKETPAAMILSVSVLVLLFVGALWMRMKTSHRW